jgi:hypothetical protein
MLKDIRDSWKLANFAASSLPFPMSPRIISHVYWPEMPAASGSQTINSLQMHPIFKEALVAYEKVYSQHKAGRNITWQNEFGSVVELELEVDGTVVELEAPLAQAQIIFLFTEKGEHFVHFIFIVIPCRTLGDHRIGGTNRPQWTAVEEAN